MEQCDEDFYNVLEKRDKEIVQLRKERDIFKKERDKLLDRVSELKQALKKSKMVTESQARMDEYIEESKLSQDAIIEEIREEKDKEIQRLKRNKDTWKAKAERLIDYNNSKDKEVEQLKKEKKWLINLWGMPYREKIVKDMQQALKGEG